MARASLRGPSTIPRHFHFPSLHGHLARRANYIGFDSISTLSEETREPNIFWRRCWCAWSPASCRHRSVRGATGVADFAKFPDVDTAYVYVAGRIGGQLLFQLVNVTLLVATIGSGRAADWAARVLFGMGRDQALPEAFATWIRKRKFPAATCGSPERSR